MERLPERCSALLRPFLVGTALPLYFPSLPIVHEILLVHPFNHQATARIHENG